MTQAINVAGCLLVNRPTSPAVLFQYANDALECQKLDISVEFHVSTAFVNIKGEWQNRGDPLDCLFVLPLLGTVTSVNVSTGANRHIESLLVSNDEAENISEKIKSHSDSDHEHVPHENRYDQYIPNLFRFPINNVEPYHKLRLEVNFIEPLSFHASQYHFALPLRFPPGTLPNDKPLLEVVSIKCTLHSISKETKCVSVSHDLRSSCNYPTIHLEAVSEIGEMSAWEDPTQVRGSDFKLSYSMATDKVFGTVLLPDHEYSTSEEKKELQHDDDSTSFCLFVSPPTKQSVEGRYKRNIVFLLDRSGSMVGDPFDEATRSLEWAIGHLKPHDKFSVISFDHRQVLFTNELVPADVSNVEGANMWIKSFQPERGGTNIKTPLSFALGMLDQETKKSVNASQYMNFVFLITDGCVAGEREICHLVRDHCKNHSVRILTLGIGTYCNWFFLKMLSQIGRGFSDVVVYKENIFPKVLRLLDTAAVAVLTDIQILIDGVDEYQLYPTPIPDLFINSPLTIAGKYIGKFPKMIAIRGHQFDNTTIDIPIKVSKTSKVPVDKILLKQRVDLLTSQCWLEDSKVLEREIVQLSLRHSMPSAYVKMVGIEVDDTPPDDGKKKNISRKKLKKKEGILAAAAIGGAFLVGAAAFSFGDLGQSIANAPVDATFGGDAGGEIGGDCCDCEDCADCDCADCLVC